MNLIKKTLSQNFWFSVINMNAEMVKKIHRMQKLSS